MLFLLVNNIKPNFMEKSVNTSGYSSGTVQFFDVKKGFGKIKVDEGNSEVFIHFSQIQGDAKVLIENELVEFELEKGSRGPTAKNLKRSCDRYVGIIEHFEYGFGFIKATGSDEKYFAHHTEFIGKGGLRK
jgi:CspA family cold shock protein